MDTPKRRRAGIGLGLALLLTHCTTSLVPAPDLGGIYNRAAQSTDARRNPIIVIPGVLGTRLRDASSGRTVWGSFVGTYADPRRGNGAELVALPMRRGAALHELKDEVEPDGVLESVRVSLLGLPIEQHAYLSILRTLGAGGYRDQQLGEAGAIDYGEEHFTCFQFAYDWRRDNVENARRLHEFILAKKAYVEAELSRRYGIERDVRFDLVAHSMGGLLARYYLRYGGADLPEQGDPEITWAGARHVARLVMVGTPNAGSLGALSDLVVGSQLHPILPRYPPAVVGTMPAIYQLLPRDRHAAVVDDAGQPVELYSVESWERFGWGLLGPGAGGLLEQWMPETPDRAARQAIAREHVERSLRRAQRFHSALDAPATPPPGTTLHLFSGDAVATPAVMRAEVDGSLTRVEWGPGDGQVLRSSAVMDERLASSEWRPGVVTPIDWHAVTFVFSDHLGMTRDPSFTDNLLWQLLEAPR